MTTSKVAEMATQPVYGPNEAVPQKMVKLRGWRPDKPPAITRKD